MNRKDWQIVLSAGACLLLAQALVFKGLSTLVVESAKIALGKS